LERRIVQQFQECHYQLGDPLQIEFLLSESREKVSLLGNSCPLCKRKDQMVRGIIKRRERVSERREEMVGGRERRRERRKLLYFVTFEKSLKTCPKIFFGHSGTFGG
jgi:hypothetical protein